MPFNAHQFPGNTLIRMYRHITFTIALTLLCGISFAQLLTSHQDQYKLHIRKASTSIKVDGLFDEEAWDKAETSTDFIRKFPNDLAIPIRRTIVKTTYDDAYIYFAFTSYDSSTHVIQSLKRDGGHEMNDAVGVVIDPLNQRTGGFFFVVSAFNTQTDDQLNGGSDQLSLSWDNKWYSATKRYADHWTAEIAIPFKTIRYKGDRKLWGINFLRSDLKTNEYSCWTRIPINFKSYDLGYTGSLLWDSPPPPAGSNMAFIPYVTGNLNSNKENNQPLKAGGNAGFDAKVALSSSLNLDLTVNPDFSQIEVDQQVTNLTRFNIFLPEKRTFFLENSDIFSGYGIEPIRPFYSRRIGLDDDGNAIPIYGGARLSGNLGSRTRIGIMNMETGRKNGYAGQNYSAISVNQGLFKRSLIKGYFLNRQGFMTEAEKQQDPLKAYGRNAGGEFAYSNLKGTWNAWLNFNKSFKPGIHTENTYGSTGIGYSDDKFSMIVDVTSVGTNYYTDMGYVERIENYDAARDTIVRVGFKHLFTEATWRIAPPKGKINRHTFNLSNYRVVNPDYSLNENNLEFDYQLEFSNTASLNAEVSNNTVQLLFPISFTDATPIPVARYKYSNGSIKFNSDIRKTFNYFLMAGGGEFYNGTVKQLQTGFTYRKQPSLSFTLAFEYNQLRFPLTYGKTELFLIAPRVEISFSTNLFWTTFLQYNTQNNNFNINSRFQWRYKPMSDLFLVYTDNYFTDPLLKNKSRALVLKLNYWLNL